MTQRESPIDDASAACLGASSNAAATRDVPIDRNTRALASSVVRNVAFDERNFQPPCRSRSTRTPCASFTSTCPFADSGNCSMTASGGATTGPVARAQEQRPEQRMAASVSKGSRIYRFNSDVSALNLLRKSRAGSQCKGKWREKDPEVRSVSPVVTQEEEGYHHRPFPPPPRVRGSD